MIKTCAKCGFPQSYSDFSSHMHGRDGRLSTCKGCCCAASSEAYAKRIGREVNPRKGAPRGVRHGYTGTRVHRSWMAMRGRCEQPTHSHYGSYGGRGITVCDRWKRFENFLADMGEPPTPLHSIDRIDNNSGYYRENCRWATPSEQSSNRRPFKWRRRAVALGENKL